MLILEFIEMFSVNQKTKGAMVIKQIRNRDKLSVSPFLGTYLKQEPSSKQPCSFLTTTKPPPPSTTTPICVQTPLLPLHARLLGSLK